jgi:UDP:flavonoid glycosyltransferase YjiC (YdhE family)
MANILIVTRGMRSLVYPSVELGRRLSAAGHEVTFAGDPETRALATINGLNFTALAPDASDDFRRTDAGSGFGARIRQVRRRRALASAELGVEAFAATLAQTRPDLVLINGEMHEHIIVSAGVTAGVAASAGVRVALINLFVSIWRQPGLPPPHHLARPGASWRGHRAGAALLWANLRLRRARRRRWEQIRHVGCDRVSLLQDLARRYGFDFAAETDHSQWLLPFTYRRLPVLSLHAREFEFPHRPPNHVHYVGPMLLRTRSDRPTTVADRTRVDNVIARRKSTSTRRLLYAGFGSTLTTDVGLLRRLVSVVNERPDWDLVVSLSDRLSPDALGPVSERVHLFSWVPQLELLQHADAAIIHGGINTIDECVACGVPMLIYCGGETDMAGSTSRALYHGLGLAGDRRRDDTSAIRGRLDRLLTARTIAAHIQRMQQQYAAYVEDHVAERIVDDLLNQPPPYPARGSQP